MLNKFTISLLFLALTVFYSCKDPVTSNPVGNQAPTTKLFLSPDSIISQQQSKIHLYWSGDDPDGTIIGFYYSWDGINWMFTTHNDSLFSLQIGAVDTIYDFRVSAVDNSGDGVYHSDVFQNGIHYGPEPFIDLNSNGRWDKGEPFTDIGLIDPHPAQLKLPIKNTAPTIAWNVLSTHPDTTYSAMSFGWNASDIDGNSTIDHINIALNDISDSTKIVSLNGTVSIITIRTNDFTGSNPLMDIYINGDPTNQPVNPITGQKIKLPGLLFNSNNIFYVQAVDISGAKSPWLSSETQPTSKSGWFVKKPVGKIIIIDDYKSADNAPAFYTAIMDSLHQFNPAFSGQYDVYDIAAQKLPYLNVSFLETIKLFSCTLWYSDNNPSLDVANATVQKYTDLGNKIFFSLQFPQFVDLTQVSGFLPISSDSSYSKTFIFPGTIVSDTSHLNYPQLTVVSSLARAMSFKLGPGAKAIYYFPNKELSGYMGFENSNQRVFFIGMPLHKINGIPGSVTQLLNKVLLQDFNLTL
jgi:hypothetical protein